MKSILNLIIITAILVFFAVPAHSATLSVGADGVEYSGEVSETVEIPIIVDNPEKIAGAAFTLVYSNKLSVNVRSSFFDTFVKQFENCDLNQTEITELLAEVETSQPLITNPIADGDDMKMLIAAARCTPATEADGTTLFTVDVALKPEFQTEANAAPYDLTLTPTKLYNTDAGYEAAGETIDLLVGSDLNKPLTDPLAFPVLLDDEGYVDVSGTVAFISGITDSDGDGISDDWEMTYFWQEGLSPEEILAIADASSDFDQDGYSDLQEYLNNREGLKDPSGASYDPTVVNAPGGQGYKSNTIITPILMLLLSD